MKDRDEDTKNHVKSNIVKMFDNASKQVNSFDKIFKDAKDLLEKTLKEFDSINSDIYA